MENSGEHADKPLSLSKMVRIDEVCDRFDRAIQEAIQNSGAWPSVEDYLGNTTEPVRSKLRKELLAVEASCRQQQAKGKYPDPRPLKVRRKHACRCRSLPSSSSSV